MLTLSSGSTCDVCLEQFGADHKAPYSIHCGHVFCFGCITRVSPPECPLCRTPYTPGSWRKLHVDMSALCLTGADIEARRLHEAIGEVTTQGSSESYLRRLIEECRNFLQGQPRSMYADLRVTCRVVSYLCDVRSNLRSQNAAVDSLKVEIAQLTAEREQLRGLEDLSEQVALLAADKSELQDRLEASESARDNDKEAAVDMELKLKEHVTRAENAYQTLLDRYSCVVQEYASLNQELKDLRLKLYDHVRSAMDPSNSGVLPRSSPRNGDTEEPILGPDQPRSRIPYSQVPDSYIIPASESLDKSSTTCNGTSSTVSDGRKGAEGDEEVYSRKKLVRCSAIDHPRSCQCDDELEYSTPPTHLKRTSIPRPAFIIEHANSGNRRRGSLSAPIGPETQSGLSRTAPKNQEYGNNPDRTRIRSLSDVSLIPSRPPSRSHSRPDEDNQQPSEPVSRSESPSPDHDISPSSGREGSIHIPTTTQNDNRRRLYNILQKPPPLSSSPTELSSSYGSSHRPRCSGSRSRSHSRSRSGSTASFNQPLPTSSAAPTGSVQPTHSVPYSQPALPQPSVISRASDAAMAIEKSQKERQMAEKALREKEKEKERREHPKSSDKDTERQDVERATRKAMSGTSTTTSNYSVPSYQQGRTHVPGLSGSPHRESFVSAPSISSASASAANTPIQKISVSSASHSLGRKNSVNTSFANHPRHNPDSQRDNNVAYQTQSYRHGSGNSKSATSSLHNTSTAPTISV